MFIKNENRPSVLVDVRLIFDDCVKDITIKKGMYATFQYMQNGISNTVSGLVTNIAFHEDKLMGNSELKSIRPINTPGTHKPYYHDISCKDPNHPCDQYYTSVPYNGCYFIEVDTASVYNSNKVKIYIDSIIDVNVLYDKCSSVVSPEGENQIQYIRRSFDGLIEYSDNGVQWYKIDGSNAAESNTDISILKTENAALKDIVEKQAERIKNIEDILKSLNITIPPVNDENSGSTEDNKETEEPSTDEDPSKEEQTTPNPDEENTDHTPEGIDTTK